ncbi:hypothetical protein STCU_09154 [Strigomonas culicis]|nr:hypothetical protein STCU_09154 [Strigomonas culicis]|eukprot:EPY20103.1 hypothetical protein STCU_09154 [Strigomonas culicis]
MSLRNMSDEEQLRAKQEILVMDGVNHPNVVKFRESFASETSVDIVMEYCDSGTLEDLIERQRCEGKPFPADVLIEWMAELLCALAHIHDKRIMHRDLKTSNIYVTSKNHLKLGDFGVCTILSNANEKAESMIGTPLYFAPEVCQSEFYDERSDVWSLGVVFYEMCTLRRPFDACNLFVLIQNILNEKPPPFNTGLDAAFEEIVFKMLSKDPTARPTAQELINVHLEVPKSHPSHPSQVPARSRLAQQYFGPELHFTKPWPPQEAAEARAHEEDKEKEWNRKESQIGLFRELQRTTYGIPEKLIKDPKKTPIKAGEPRLVRKTPPASKNKAVVRQPECKVAPKARNPKASSPEVCNAKNKTAGGVVMPLVLAESQSNNFSIQDLQQDVMRRRTQMFGETKSASYLSDARVAVQMRDDSWALSCEKTRPGTSGARNGKAVLSSSSFTEELAELFLRHGNSGHAIGLDELDAAALMLSQYKLSNYGLH